MKPAKIVSALMLISVLAFTLMSFATRLVDFHCYKYTGPRPVDDIRVITCTNYTEITPVNTLLTCPTPIEIWCGFCIYEDSPYWDETNQKPKWKDAGFQSLLQDGSPIEVYNDTSLHGVEIASGSRVYAYFEYTENE